MSDIVDDDDIVRRLRDTAFGIEADRFADAMGRRAGIMREAAVEITRLREALSSARVNYDTECEEHLNTKEALSSETETAALKRAINHAENELSRHIEKYHDYEGETPSRASLRGIQHHLAGSVMDDDRMETVAQRIEHAEPDEGRQDAGSTPVGLPPAAMTEQAKAHKADSGFRLAELGAETAAREKAEREIASMKEMRKRLDRRIHCQRKSNRDEWEIVERRAKGLRSSAIYCIVAHRDVSIKLRGAETAIADLTRKLEAAAGALVCAEQQCETAVYNISQRDHDDAVVRSFRSIAGYCAREARAAILGEEKL